MEHGVCTNTFLDCTQFVFSRRVCWHRDEAGTTVPAAYLHNISQETRQRLRIVVDTTILKVRSTHVPTSCPATFATTLHPAHQAMLALPDTGALLRFCATPTVAADLQEAKASLEATGRYSELVALLQQRGRHAEALSLLHLLSSSPQRLQVLPTGAAADLQGLPGVWAAVKYVAACAPGSLEAKVVDAHAPWILAADPEAGLEMFLQVGDREQCVASCPVYSCPRVPTDQAAHATRGRPAHPQRGRAATQGALPGGGPAGGHC